MEQETLYNILTGQYGEILETHAMWQCIASLGIKPFKDGNMWCYLYGDNIQEGICGFGETIYKAAWDFYSNIKTEELRKENREGEIFRREATKDLMLSATSMCDHRDYQKSLSKAIEMADELIKQLKEKSNESTR